MKRYYIYLRRLRKTLNFLDNQQSGQGLNQVTPEYTPNVIATSTCSVTVALASTNRTDSPGIFSHFLYLSKHDNLQMQNAYLNKCNNEPNNAHNVQSLHKPHLHLFCAASGVPHILVTFITTGCK